MKADWRRHWGSNLTWPLITLQKRKYTSEAASIYIAIEKSIKKKKYLHLVVCWEWRGQAEAPPGQRGQQRAQPQGPEQEEIEGEEKEGKEKPVSLQFQTLEQSQ